MKRIGEVTSVCSKSCPNERLQNFTAAATPSITGTPSFLEVARERHVPAQPSTMGTVVTGLERASLFSSLLEVSAGGVGVSIVW